MKCPYCTDTLEGDYCNTCQECTVDIDHPSYYSDSEEFEQPDTHASIIHYNHTNEVRNERYK